MPTLVIVGTGMIGGSIARAARARGVVDCIIGVDANPQSLAAAGALGLIDVECAGLAEAAAQADLLIVCTPVDTVAEQILLAARSCRPGTLLTDAASTKASIVRRVEAELPPGVAFVGGHPLAGSEKNGPGSADGELFQSKLVLLTPTQLTAPTVIDRVAGFWEALGAEVKTIDPEHHDQALALTSHLPHLVASALAGILPLPWQGLTGTGFRDTTRLANSHARLWLPIFQDNRAAVLTALDLLRAQLDAFATALTANDAPRLVQLLEQGRQARQSLC